MSITRNGGYGTPGLARGVETLRSLEAKQDEAIRRVMPGASPEVLDDAARFLMRIARLAGARRRHEREPQESLWVTFLKRERERKEAAERRLLKAGVPHVTLERLEELYPLADDLLREHLARTALELDHGCAKCRHCLWSWERSLGDPQGPARPFCEVYGDVPAFCFDFKATRFCSGCGKRVSPKKAAECDPIPVQCAACKARTWAA